jgi:hypothetical protein
VKRATGVWIAAGVVLAFGTTHARAEEPHVTGVYLSSRLNADGSQYQGLVYVVRDQDSFLVSWMDLQSKDGQLIVVPAAAGVGLVEGRVFAVSQYSLRTIGLMVYRIEDDGRRLIGRWATAESDGAAYSETLTRLPEHVPEPVVPGRQQNENPGDPSRHASRGLVLPTSAAAVPCDRAARSSVCGDEPGSLTSRRR